MKCPNCQANNREDAKFRNACGGKLEIACPQCSNFNSPGSTHRTFQRPGVQV